ncbi:MAG: response regulator [Gammaproteobacteria bacterium]|nr:response regulator [Gammaproteobacteria bacterium]
MTKKEQRVLLIDHSGTALAIITKLIHKHIRNTIVDIATSSGEAIELLIKNKYQLITMSRNLPDIDCHDLVKKIRVELHNYRTPLIVVSGEDMGVLEEQIACQYVNGYFDKKLGQKKLVGYIKSFLSYDGPAASITGNILYVEDSATVAQAVKSFLTQHGHNYLLAKDAEHALQNIQHSFNETHNVQPFDLILTDIQLEGHMSGRDLIREIRYGIGLGYEQLPILVTTSSNYDADPDGLNRIFSAGANDILEKPIREPMLVARINTLLTLRQQYLQLHHPENAISANQ